jgi:hypothetical protein
MTTVIAYWLLPAEPARSFLADIIGELAARFAAPIFTPHLTLFIASENSCFPAKVLKKLGSVAINLPIFNVSFSERFTKTLFVRFEKTHSLQRLSSTITELSGDPRRDLTDPHLSLLYKHLPDETKRELANSIQFPFHQVTFDSICAMRCASPTRSPADVRAWKLA